MNYLSILVVSFSLIGLIGCHPHINVDHHSPPAHHETVVIQPAHSCSHHDACGHTWDGGSWIEIRNHRHGPGCGHVHSGGRWSLDINRGPHNTKVEVHIAKTPLGWSF